MRKGERVKGFMGGCGAVCVGEGCMSVGVKVGVIIGVSVGV